MPFQIIRNDITKVKADAIINTANPFPQVGAGTDSAVYHAAGKEKLLAERKKIGLIQPGEVCIEQKIWNEKNAAGLIPGECSDGGSPHQGGKHACGFSDAMPRLR